MASDQPTHPQRRAGWPPTKGHYVRKLIMRIAILALLGTVFIGVAGASPAAAANCAATATSATTYSPHPTYNVSFKAQVASCDYGVDKVQFAQCPASPGVASGWADSTTGHDVACQQTQSFVTVLYHCEPTACADDQWTYPYTYTQWCWYSGANHLVRPFWQYRIHNIAGGGSYGPWHTVYGIQDVLSC